MRLTASLYKSCAVSAVALAALAACGGESGIAPTLQGAANVVASSAGLRAWAKVPQPGRGRAEIVIRVPFRHKIHYKTGPFYVGATTQSMSVKIAGEPTQTLNLSPSTQGCAIAKSSAELTCAFDAFAPSGKQTLTISLFDQPNGQGYALSTATTTVAIAPGAVTTLHIVLDGVPASAEILLGQPGAPAMTVAQGTAATLPVTVNAYDADDDLIMTPGKYTSPIYLTDSDTSGATTLSAKTATAPGASITLNYDGKALSSATITPSLVKGLPQTIGTATLAATSSLPLISEYEIPTQGAAPWVIALGPDGALWFTECGSSNVIPGRDYVGKIGRIVDGQPVREYPLPSNMRRPIGITPGPDGALWFTAYGNRIGRISTTGAITEFPKSQAEKVSVTDGITTGPDGALWFTESPARALGSIGRITTKGVIKEYPITGSSSPAFITAGPDGALWFTDDCGSIGRITTGGVVKEYPIPSNASQYAEPAQITPGPDGALWFTEYLGGKIGRITTTGVVTEYPIPNGNGPFGISAGPDGALWFAEYGGDLGRITTNGKITEYSTLPGPGFLSNELRGIAAGRDAALWAVANNSNIVVRASVTLGNAARQLRPVLQIHR